MVHGICYKKKIKIILDEFQSIQNRNGEDFFGKSNYRIIGIFCVLRNKNTEPYHTASGPFLACNYIIYSDWICIFLCSPTPITGK